MNSWGSLSVDTLVTEYGCETVTVATCRRVRYCVCPGETSKDVRAACTHVQFGVECRMRVICDQR